jgi:hypothetical protein
MSDTVKIALDMFVANLRQTNIAVIDEDDPRFVVYSVRLPSEARLDHDSLVTLSRDTEFGLALAVWLEARAAGVRRDHERRR